MKLLLVSVFMLSAVLAEDDKQQHKRGLYGSEGVSGYHDTMKLKVTLGVTVGVMVTLDPTGIMAK